MLFGRKKAELINPEGPTESSVLRRLQSCLKEDQRPHESAVLENWQAGYHVAIQWLRKQFIKFQKFPVFRVSQSRNGSAVSHRFRTEHQASLSRSYTDRWRESPRMLVACLCGDVLLGLCRVRQPFSFLCPINVLTHAFGCHSVSCILPCYDAWEWSIPKEFQEIWDKAHIIETLCCHFRQSNTISQPKSIVLGHKNACKDSATSLRFWMQTIPTICQWYPGSKKHAGRLLTDSLDSSRELLPQV